MAADDVLCLFLAPLPPLRLSILTDLLNESVEPVLAITLRGVLVALILADLADWTESSCSSCFRETSI
jgi:hypothetical protein